MSERDAREGFRAAFGVDPNVVVRAPGRVNLIGEHTDYSELPVLPIAIERALFVAAGPSTGAAVAARSREFDDDGPWHRYVDGAVEQLRAAGLQGGANLFVASDLPHVGGLSSSSALTCGVLAALSAAWNAALARGEIVRLAIAAEHTVGVESGGMDQETILFSEPDAALRIDFRPPARKPVRIPDGLSFVVASSGETALKGGNARDAYNDRVVGTRMAAALLATRMGIRPQLPPKLAQVVGAADFQVEELPDSIAAIDVSRITGIDVEALVQLTTGSAVERRALPVKRYARHVLTEAERVDAAEEALNTKDLRAFGQLLDESHASLRDDYSCSTPALDRLCDAMRHAGALGARLTGAGFGGFALAACEPRNVDRVIDAAIGATGGPAFEVHASGGLEWL